MTDQPAIIVADDEPSVRLVTQCALERAGFQVLCAENGREALELFNAHHACVCAAVLDVSMPRLNGIDAALEMLRRHPEVIIVLTSGYDESESQLDFPAASSVRFMEKPFDLNELVEYVCANTN